MKVKHSKFGYHLIVLFSSALSQNNSPVIPISGITHLGKISKFLGNYVFCNIFNSHWQKFSYEQISSVKMAKYSTHPWSSIVEGDVQPDIPTFKHEWTIAKQVLYSFWVCHKRSSSQLGQIVHPSSSKELHEPSGVTSWLNYLFSIGPLATMKICPIS